MDVNRTANESQQAAIDARGGLITVSAGAGTGKTWTLASRYASILLDKDCGCGVENIITLTFTEKAAQEMKERIEAVIREKINSAADNEKIILRNALAHFDNTYILTIHSFASGILRESALALGLDPQSQIISQPQDDELTEELGRKIDELDKTVTSHFEDTASLERILSIWKPEDIAVLSKECEEMHSALGLSYEDFLHLGNDNAIMKVIEKVREISMPQMRTAYEKWGAALDNVSGEISEGRKGKMPGYILNLRGLREKWYANSDVKDGGELIEFFTDLMESALKIANFGKLKEPVSLSLGENLKDWKERHQSLLKISKNLSFDAIKSNYPEDLTEREALIKLCSACWRMLEIKRGENKSLSFSDLIKFGSEGLARSQKKNFRQIMVDEFQDTDPLQESMIRSMAQEPDVSVFVVGDPKQSIYRFRNADLSIFERYVNESKKIDGYIKMNDSFRMRSELYRKINGLFRYIWPENLGSGIKNLKYEDLRGEADRERDSGTLPIMSLLTGKQDKKLTETEPDNSENSDDVNAPESGKEKKEKIDEVRKRLLNKLTDTLLRWKAAELTLWDSREKRVRPFEWGDCAILTQTRTSWPLIEESFAHAGIPLEAEGNVSWFSHGEVADIINMLRAIAYPGDKLANTGWHSSFLSPRGEAEEEFLRRTGKIRGGAAILNYFLDNSAWLKNIPAPQRLRALANMRYASQLAEDYERLICCSIHGCSEWLSKSLKSQKRFEEPQVTDGGWAVKLLTVHASKGLEFPFVIIWGTELPPGSKKNNGSLTASKYLGLFASKHELFKMFHYALEDEAEREEYQRLLYVAATRAKDSILFCGITDGEGNAASGSWLNYLTGWNSQNGDMVHVDVINENIKGSLFAETESLPQPDIPEIVSENNVKLELPEPEVSLTRISATSYALYEWCPFAWRRKYRQGADLDFENYAYANRENLSGKDIGSITHWILSKWDFSAEELDHYLPGGKELENIIQLLPPSLRASYRSSSNREKIRNWLSGFAGSDIGVEFRKLSSENKLKREVKFKISLGNKIKLVGAFDVFWEDKDGVHLRDWKTNPGGSALGLYKNQLAFYALALQRLKGKFPSVGIISVNDSKLLNNANDGHISDIEDKILKMAAEAVSGQWEPKTENCPACPLGCI